MAHYATKRYNYWSQLAILAGLCGAGLIIGGIAMLIPILGAGNLKGDDLSTQEMMGKLVKQENATSILRWAQAIATPFIFLLPAWMYARICHIKPARHFGFQKEVTVQQVLLVILITISAMPVVAALQEVTEMLPWSKAMLARFNIAEEEYNRQVAVLTRMKDFNDYLVSLFIVALMPAVMEEVMFRGAWQNLFSRWFKMPVLALIIVSALFSAVHGSYLGFLSRFALGMVLGWMYYRTGNIWLNIIAHFFNNAVGVTMLYQYTKPGETADPAKIDERFPLWIGAVGLLVMVALFIAFEKASKKQIDRPGEEVLIPGYNYSNNPFYNDFAQGQ